MGLSQRCKNVVGTEEKDETLSFNEREILYLTRVE